jgi:hypothetical protein
LAQVLDCATLVAGERFAPVDLASSGMVGGPSHLLRDRRRPLHNRAPVVAEPTAECSIARELLWSEHALQNSFLFAFPQLSPIG